MVVLPRPNDLLYICVDASVQFQWRPITVRVIEVMEPETTRTDAGWCWLRVRQLTGECPDEIGGERELYLKIAGLWWWHTDHRHRNRTKPVRAKYPPWNSRPAPHRSLSRTTPTTNARSRPR